MLLFQRMLDAITHDVDDHC